MDDLAQFLVELERESRDAGRMAQLQALRRRYELAAELLEMRQASGLTQTALAQASGVQQSEISRIERGHANPTVQTMEQLANAMGMRVAFVPMTTHKTRRAPTAATVAPRRRRTVAESPAAKRRG